ncbi:isoaspartyl peptidase/L-asparaginase [Massilia terrae]|uniref:Isoaspartyl peptidase/L-asparaginase n=1 Tax=Massilia terrae TaxID=1811224 RepID=A0ABT2CVW3_9BURK|nr:isoaspartyl peptidase/L-asparaginase [Massilia terrae]MCS0657350.1 isoaspartyl peptidase/L-asparaginase [Massilia terrae]
MSNTEVEWAIVVHGGAGAPCELKDGCERAAARGLERLREGADALDAAVSAVVTLEDDGRYNAGTGAIVGLDGETIELDASVMDSRGRLGAVACVRDVRNPILLARSVAETPHCLLAGEGADRLARAIGLSPHPGPAERQRAAHRNIMHQLAGALPAMPGVDNHAFLRFWNYNSPLELPECAACDTVGAVVRDGDGQFALAGSTGGSAPSLLGRVGDTPIVGAGFYAGPEGAVAATGGVDQIDKRFPIGLIAVSRHEAASCSNRDMPSARIIGK